MKKILVVDDSPTMRRMIISSLRELTPLQFEEAGSGLVAIEKLALFRFDLVLLDLNMPDIHGIEVLQFIRDHKIYGNIPVIILTTKSDDKTRSDVVDAGASLFMTKPYVPAELTENVRKLLTN